MGLIFVKRHDIYYTISLSSLIASLIILIVGVLVRLTQYFVPISIACLALSIVILLKYSHKLYHDMLRLRLIIHSLIKIRSDKARLATLKPKRKRYIVFEVLYDGSLNFNDMNSLIMNSFKKLFGDYGISEFNIKLLQYDDKLKRGILRTNNVSKEAVIAGLSFIREINGKPISIYPIKTSGTLKKAREILNTLKTD